MAVLNFDPDRLAQLKLNPLLCESYKNFSLCKDNDPDMNFYLENSSCEYLGKINWAELPGLDDPSCAYKIFIEKYVAIYDRCFPLKRKKAK